MAKLVPLSQLKRQARFEWPEASSVVRNYRPCPEDRLLYLWDQADDPVRRQAIYDCIRAVFYYKSEEEVERAVAKAVEYEQRWQENLAAVGQGKRGRALSVTEEEADALVKERRKWKEAKAARES